MSAAELTPEPRDDDQGANAASPPPALSVATPRSHHSRETYLGHELGSTSNRPGAYAAFALPSMLFGERRVPTPPHVEAVIQAREQRARERGQRGHYTMRAGSVPAQVVAYLEAHGGYLTFGQIALLFSLAPTSVAATLKPAVTGGALVRHTIAARSALALPGYEPPPECLAEPTPEQVALARRLEPTTPPRGP
jgi:hypothetical protein